MILITNTMKQTSSKTRLFWRRTIFVIGALFCLCVSDSAGPRLLPLPAPSISPTLRAFSPERGNWASRTPSPNKEQTPYLQMVGGWQYRARDYHYHAQPATHAPQGFCRLQQSNLVTTPETYAPLNFKTPSLSIPTGRAPPRFV
jgi:hypothetical protein